MTAFNIWIIALIELSVLASNCQEQKFKKMCQTYRSSSPTQNAVLWIGDGDYSGKANIASFVADGFDKGDYFIASQFQKNNPAVTAVASAGTPSGQGGPSKKKKKTEKPKHDEDVILDNALPLIQKYTAENSGQKPDLFLYSYKSPCCGPEPTSKKLAHENCPNGCSGLIRDWLTKNKDKIKTMTVAWDVNYLPWNARKDQHFLFGMYSILSAPGNLKIHWNDEGYCRRAKRGWFQKEMFNCVNTEKNAPICTAKKDFEPHLASLINHVTWKCGTRTLIRKEVGTEVYDKAARESACWEKEVSTVVTKTDDKANTFKKALKDCAKELEDVSDVLLGPALKYRDKLEYSNSALDVKAGIGSLCFIK